MSQTFNDLLPNKHLQQTTLDALRLLQVNTLEMLNYLHKDEEKQKTLELCIQNLDMTKSMILLYTKVEEINNVSGS